MAYDVSIIRKTDQENSSQIPLAELLASSLVEAHATMLGEDKGTVTFRFHLAEGRSEFLYWKDGDIWSSNPDEEWFTFLVRLAGSLGGVLQGDEGELYLPDGTVLPGEGAPRSARSLFFINYVRPISRYILLLVVLCIVARLIRDFLA